MSAADLAETLVARKSAHGDFTDHARITQELKQVLRSSPSYERMSPIMREAAEMILHKVGRLCAGDPTHKDTWHDIAGYARLVEERIP